MISFFKFTILGILWCMGGDIEKAQELYLTMAPGEHSNMAAETKLFDKNIEYLIKFSTEIPLDLETKHMGTKRTRFLTEA